MQELLFLRENISGIRYAMRCSAVQTMKSPYSGESGQWGVGRREKCWWNVSANAVRLLVGSWNDEEDIINVPTIYLSIVLSLPTNRFFFVVVRLTPFSQSASVHTNFIVIIKKTRD